MARGAGASAAVKTRGGFNAVYDCGRSMGMLVVGPIVGSLRKMPVEFDFGGTLVSGIGFCGASCGAGGTTGLCTSTEGVNGELLGLNAGLPVGGPALS